MAEAAFSKDPKSEPESGASNDLREKATVRPEVKAAGPTARAPELSSATFSHPEATTLRTPQQIRLEQAKLEGCIEKHTDPESLLKTLNSLSEALGRNPVNPVAAKVRTPDKQEIVLSGAIYDMSVELRHVKKLLNIAHETIVKAHYEKPGVEGGSIRTNGGRGDSIVAFKAFDDLLTYKDKLMPEFFRLIHEFPRHSEQLQNDQIKRYGSLYKEPKREWQRPEKLTLKQKLKSALAYPFKQAALAVAYPAKKLIERFRGKPAEAEKQQRRSDILEKTFDEPVLKERFKQQLETLDLIKHSPVIKARYALILAARSLDSVRKQMAGLYFSEKERTEPLTELSKSAPVSRYRLTAEVARSKHTFVISTKGVQGIEKLAENTPKTINLKDTLMFNTAVATAVENRLRDTAPLTVSEDSLKKLLKDLNKGRINEVEVIREGNEVSVLLSLDGKTERFALGFIDKEEGISRLITPNLKGLQKLHKTSDIGLEDVVMQNVPGRRGKLHSELMVLHSDRITSIRKAGPCNPIEDCPAPGAIEIGYHEIKYLPRKGVTVRTLGGNRTGSEFMRKAVTSIDALRKLLDDSRFRKHGYQQDFLVSG